jgi:hypothetical protein
MSKKNNVNPDHYKTAGRERQGEDIVHDVYKRRYMQSRSIAGAHARNFISGSRTDEHIYKPRIDEAHRKGGGK